MEISQEQISKVLSDISSRIPKNLLKNAFREEKLTPTVEFVFKKSLEDPKISEEKKSKIKSILDSGDVSKMKILENHRVTKMIDQFWGREINKAIKQGRLPPRSKIMELPDFKHFMKGNEQVQKTPDTGTHRDQRTEPGTVMDSTPSPRTGI